MEYEKIIIQFDFEAFKDCFYMNGPFDEMIEELFELVKNDGLTDSSYIGSIEIVLNDLNVSDELIIEHNLVRGINYWYKSKMMIKDKIVKEITENGLAECPTEDAEETVKEDTLSKIRNRVDRAIDQNNIEMAQEWLEVYRSYKLHILEM